jgi:hypothetical protein
MANMRRYPQTQQQADAAGTAAMLGAKGGAPLVGAFRDSDVTLTSGPAIGSKEVGEAVETLQKYRRGKSNFENRIISEEQWWKLRHWEDIRRGTQDAGEAPEPVSAWLFNSITNKHADAMDNYPEPVCLPREPSDEESAKTLSAVLPVIMEYNEFDNTYSVEWWEKLKHGVAIYGIFWDKEKENGLGDIAIERIDPLNIFWEPGVEDIQKSRNVFTVSLVDEDILEEEYPQFAGKIGGSSVSLAKYEYDDSIDTSGKVAVVDWYYRKKDVNGRMVLHYVKFIDEEHIIYASENDPECAEDGFYADGEYPVVFDTLFPERGSPAGFGYTAIAKDPQLYIDKLWGNILETSMMGSKRRYFASESLNINEQEFLDWRKPIIHVSGEINDNRLREVVTRPLDGIYANIVQMKIDEMKETSANRDVSNGGTSSGATAAAAISALQEAGNKASRDMIAGGYRAQTKIVRMCIERMRQFYDATRSFRITNEMPYEYAQIGMNELGDQVTGVDSLGNELFRRPVFDIKIKAQKKNPFSRAEQNERAKELYSLGFFSPDRAQESMIALDMMDFEGIDKIKSQVNEGATLYNVVQQQSEQLQKALAVIGQLTGQDMGLGAAAPGAAPGGGTSQPTGSSGGIESRNADAQGAKTPYMQKLAERSKPNMETGSSAAMPGM